MFNALRRLLMSGDLRGVLQESRRAFQDIADAVTATPNASSRQRALDDMNARGGVGNRFGRTGPGGAIDYLNAQGVDPSTSAPFTRQPGGNWGTPAPGGGMVTLGRPFGTGPRFREPYQTGEPGGIVAPYEGMRVWERSPYGGYEGPGPWMGGGRAPYAEYDEYGDFPQYSAPVTYGMEDYAELGDPTRVPLAFGGSSDYGSPYAGSMNPFAGGQTVPVDPTNPWGRQIVPWENLMRTQPMDGYNRFLNIPF